MNCYILSIVLLCFLITNAFGKINQGSYIIDSTTKEPIKYATIISCDSTAGTTSNDAGFFLFNDTNQIPNCIIISCVGYETKIVNNYSNDSKIYLSPNIQLQDVAIYRNRNHEINGSVQKMNIKKMEVFPTLLSESDLLKSLQLMPGISSGNEGSAGIYIRGSSADQNQYLLDGVEIYNPYHIYGFFSSFNSKAIKNVDVYKGNFPARFGGKLASVIDIQQKEGNMKKINTEINISTISTNVTLDGPIIKDKLSFLISGRQSYFDIFTSDLVESMGNYSAASNSFYDLNGKLHYNLNANQSLDFFFFKGRDKSFTLEENYYNGLYSSTENKNNWGNEIFSLTYKKKINSNVTFSNQLSSSNYDYHFSSQLDQTDIATNKITRGAQNSGMQNISNHTKIVYTLHKHNFTSGIQYDFQTISPELKSTYFYKDSSLSENTNSLNNTIYKGNQLALYIEDDFKMNDFFSINIGLRGSINQFNEFHFVHAEPRINFRIKASNKFTIHTGYNRSTQALHLLALSNVQQGSDFWIPSSNGIKPQVADQISLDLNYEINDFYRISNNYYYKQMNHLLEYKQGAIYLQGSMPYHQIVEEGTGQSYGSEIIFEKYKGKLNGWIAYGLMKSERKFPGVNNGKYYPYQFGRTHEFKVVSTCKLSKNWNITSHFIYQSGSYITIAKHLIGGQYLYYDKNNHQLPAYHRLDLSLSYSKKYKRFFTIYAFDVYNAYYKKNVYTMLQTEQREMYMRTRIVLTEKYFLPIIPSLSINLKF